ncbi:cytochrome P450 [Priestia megaterium]|uniref:Cytochrome P450 n=1 Tax=Priestia megaterium TaxID=1404 RepID=A0A3D8WU42_PRIMG|nr:cytochrome P450 [Priestia megaterium]MDH3168883.1 cytochrome P450 [Priestia megaterium]RDZ06458.1 cytochrome P450 [Priestia megaterium]
MKDQEFLPINDIKGGADKVDAYDPFSWYEKMRKESPVYYDQNTEVWNVFLYEDVKRVLSEKETFSSHFSTNKGSIGKTLINQDPPKHTQVRSIVNRSFTPRVLKEWEPRIQAITDELIQRMDGKEKIDIYKDFAHPLPIIVISELLGVPSKYMDQFKQWSDVLVSSPKSNNKEDMKEFLTNREIAERELEEFFQSIIAEKRKNLSNDLISILIRAEEETFKISEKELVPFCNLLLVAGNETTTNLLTNAVFSILENKGVYDELRNDLSLIPSMVEESLRYRSPAQVLRRKVIQDTEIGGQQLRKGETVIVWLGSANRDENKFIDASMFDIHRKPNSHIAFGHGIHFCLGAPLARMEATIAMTALIKKYSSISFPEGFTLDPIESSAVYGLRSFPVQVNK